MGYPIVQDRSGSHDPFHCAHVTTQGGTDLLNTVGPDNGIHFNQSLIIDAQVIQAQPAANNINIDVFHEISQEWQTSIVIQITAILGGIRNCAVHIKQFLTCDGIGNQRCFVQLLVVRALILDTSSGHCFVG